MLPFDVHNDESVNQMIVVNRKKKFLMLSSAKSEVNRECVCSPWSWSNLDEMSFVRPWNCIWVRSWRWACLFTWFCYHLIAKPGNKTGAPSWPDPYACVEGVIFFCKSLVFVYISFINSLICDLTYCAITGFWPARSALHLKTSQGFLT